MTIVADKRLAPAHADAVVTVRDQDGQARAKLDLLCRRAGIDPEILPAEARRRAADEL